MMMIVTETYTVIYRRYYNFSDNFSNKNEALKQIEDWRNGGVMVGKMVASEKVQVIFATAENDGIGGFQFGFEKTEFGSTIPYRYEVKDQDCEREKFYGYLNVEELRNGDNNVFYQKVKPFKPRAEVLCLEIEPLVTDAREVEYFKYLLSDEGKPLINWLFISREKKH